MMILLSTVEYKTLQIHSKPDNFTHQASASFNIRSSYTYLEMGHDND